MYYSVFHLKMCPYLSHELVIFIFMFLIYHFVFYLKMCPYLSHGFVFFILMFQCHQKKDIYIYIYIYINTETTSHGERTDPTGSELPDPQICTKPHSNNSQNTSTYNTLILQPKWFAHTKINTSDHWVPILVPHIGFTTQQLSHAWSAMHIIMDPAGISGETLRGQIPLCSLGLLSH
jgi:hypothetical protein